MEQSSNLTGLMGERVNLNDFTELASGNTKAVDNEFSRILSSVPNYQPIGRVEAASSYNPYYQEQYKPRYESTFAYKNLGFDPHRDNDALYNANMSGFDQLQRWAVGAAKLFTLGALDQFLPAKYEANRFEDAMAIGQSTTGSILGLLGNTAMSAGYTLGLITEMLAEDAAISTGIALTGLESGGATAAAGGARIASNWARFTDRAKKAWDMSKAYRRQTNIVSHIDDLASARSVPQFVTKAIDFINPFENTTDAVRMINKQGDIMTKAEKYNKAIMGVWHDIQSVKATYNEGRLEGAFAEQNMTDDYLRAYQEKYGKAPSEKEFDDFMKNAKAANHATTMMNMPLIFFTNKLTLNGLLRPINSVGVNTSTLFGRTVQTVKEGGITTIKRLPKETAERLKYYAKHPGIFVKGELKYSAANFSEGLQEVTQDIVSSAAKQYYDPFIDSTERGEWYNYILEASKDQLTSQGLETFASGFLMQKFIGPVQSVAGVAIRGGVNTREGIGERIADNVVNKVHQWTHSEESHKKWSDKRERAYQAAEDEVDRKVEQLNDILSNPEVYFNGNFEQLIKAKAFAAYVNSDDFKNLSKPEQEKAMKEQFKSFIVDVCQNGSFDIIMDQMKAMQQFSEEDLKKAVGEENAKDYKSRLSYAIENANKYKEAVDEANAMFPPLFTEKDMSTAMTNGDMQKVQMMYYERVAHRKLVNQYIFERDALKEGLEEQRRIKERIENTITSSENILNQMPYDEISTLFGPNELGRRAQQIDAILNGNGSTEGLNSLMESDMTPSEIQYRNDLREQARLIKELRKAFSKSTRNISEEKKLIKEYVNLMDDIYNGKINNNNTREHRTNDLFYEQLTEEIFNYREKALQNQYDTETIQYLSSPAVWKRRAMELAASAEYVHSQRKKEIKSSLQHAQNKKGQDALVDELSTIGVSLHEDSLKELYDKKKLPDVMYYNNGNTTIVVDYLDSHYQQALEIIRKHVPGISGIKNVSYTGTGNEAHNMMKDRTESEIIDVYCKNKLNQNQDLIDVLKTVVTEHTDANSKASQRKQFAFLAQILVQSGKFANKYNVKFISETKSDSVPLKIKGNDITINIRFFASDFINSRQVDIEYAILKGALSCIYSTELKDVNSEFTKAMKLIYEDAKAEFAKKKPEVQAKLPKIALALSSLETFVQEGLLSEPVQYFLYNTKPNKSITVNSTVNLWQSFLNRLYNFFETIRGFKRKDENLLNEFMSVTSAYINDDPIIITQAGQNNNVSVNKPYKYSEIKNMSKDELSNLPSDLLNEIIERYNLVNSQNIDSTNLTDDFVAFVKSDSMDIEMIVNKWNAEYEFDNRNVGNVTEQRFDFSSTSNQTYSMPVFIKNRFFVRDEKGVLHFQSPKDNIDPENEEFINTYIALYAIHLIANNTSDILSVLEDEEIKNLIWNGDNTPGFKHYGYRGEIEAMVYNLTHIDEYQGPNDNFGDDIKNYIDYLENKLGYPIKELNAIAAQQDGLITLKKLTIENISYKEKSRILKGNATKIEQEDSLYYLKEDIKKCKSLFELNQLYDNINKYLSTVSEKEIIIDTSELRELFDSKESELKDSPLLGNDLKIEKGMKVFIKGDDGGFHAKYLIHSIRKEDDGKWYIAYQDISTTQSNLTKSTVDDFNKILNGKEIYSDIETEENMNNNPFGNLSDDEIYEQAQEAKNTIVNDQEWEQRINELTEDEMDELYRLMDEELKNVTSKEDEDLIMNLLIEYLICKRGRK